MYIYTTEQRGLSAGDVGVQSLIDGVQRRASLFTTEQRGVSAGEYRALSAENRGVQALKPLYYRV